MLGHDIELIVYSNFWSNFESYKLEEPVEFNKYFSDYNVSSLQTKIISVAINFSGNYPDFKKNHVIITIDMEYYGKQIGYYKLLFNEDGSIADDFFVIY